MKPERDKKFSLYPVTPNSVLVHGTCIKMPGGKGAVLLLGPSGSGKSDLALRLIMRGCKLVADDQVIIKRKKEKVVAGAPESIRGLLEVRGLGITEVPYSKAVRVELVVRLASPEDVVRLPKKSRHVLLDVKIPEVTLNPFEVSAVDKVFMAYQIVREAILMDSGFYKKSAGKR